nr:AptC [Actinoallomurus sp. ID145808]
MIPLGGQQHVDHHHRHRRIGHHLLQHPHVPLGQLLSRLPVEQIDRVLQTPGQRPVPRLRPHLVHRHRQIALRRRLHRRRVLEDEHHLEQRVIRPRPIGIQQFHQTLERHVLIVMCRQRLTANPVQHHTERRIPRQINAQCPHRPGGPMRRWERRTDHHVLTGAQPRQQHAERGLQHDRRRHPAAARQLLDRRHQLRSQLQIDHSTAQTRHRRPRTIHRQRHRLHRTRQLPTPVLQLPRRHARVRRR